MTPRTSVRRSRETTCITVARVGMQRRVVDSQDRDALPIAAEASLLRLKQLIRRFRRAPRRCIHGNIPR